MTGTGQAMGTADYVSPEQVTDSRDVDIRSDLYSLGCTLFKLLTGRAPFESDKHTTAFAKMNAHVSQRPPAITDFRNDVPKGVANLIKGLMAKEPGQRPADPMQVARSLESFCEGSDLESLVKAAWELGDDFGSQHRAVSNEHVRPVASQPKTWWRRRVPFYLAIATGLFGLVFGVAFGILIKIKSPDGTETTITADKGSEVTIQVDDDTPALDIAASRESLGPTVPLMFGILDEDPNLKFSGDGVHVRRILTTGRDFVEVIEDGDVLWFPSNEGFEGAKTHRINDQKHVAISAKRSDQLLASDLLGHILSMQSSNERLQVRVDPTTGKKLQALTKNNMNKKLVVIVDGHAVSAPRIQAEISDEFVIYGKLKQAQIRMLMTIANAPRPSLPGMEDSLATILEARQILASRAGRVESAKLALEKMDELLKLIGSAEHASEVAPARNDAQGMLNLKELGLAMHNFHSVYQKFPASRGTLLGGASSVHGEPTQPFSWRVAILPFIEQMDLFEEYRFHETWDSEHNSKLLSRMPDAFRSVTSKLTPEGHTYFQGLVGDDRAMGIDKPTGFKDCTDGTSNTILLVEAENSVPWTMPQDITGVPNFPDDMVRFLLADGAVVEVPEIDPELLRKLITRNGGEVVDTKALRDAAASP